MNLQGKKLIFLDGSGLAAPAVKRAKELGVHTIVANFYSPELSPAKLVADEQWDVNFSDIDKMVDLIKENHVDGIFVGWTDSHLPHYVEICEKAGLPCCGTKEQFEILSNDKRLFKKTCIEYGVPVIPEYQLDINLRREDLDRISYPVLVKPADESGSRGIRRCDSEEELTSYYAELYEHSKSKKILVEKYIDSPKEIYVHYTVQDGYCSLSSTFMKQKAVTEGGVASSAILHVFPSSYVDLYREKANPAVVKMFEGLGLKNGIVMMQGFICGDEFYFYESGLRMGGEQFYVFADPINGINALDMMIEFSVTGKMTCGNAKKQDNPKFTKTCCNYYITLKAGTITSIAGLDDVVAMPQVLQTATFKKIGTKISATNSLDRVIYRLHVMDDSPEALAKTLEIISHKLSVLDENGKEMQVEVLSYERALEMILNS
ncbi:MAG: ATP-grasp domain-containing protein [Clostridia bacterium]|nr:ATP-grasp domain-containing protein [Clostridia bacterium]